MRTLLVGKGGSTRYRRTSSPKFSDSLVVTIGKNERRELNTIYITSSRNTTKFIVLCCTIGYTTACFDPFFRPSSGCVRLTLRVIYPDDKYTILMMGSQSSCNFSLVMAGM